MTVQVLSLGVGVQSSCMALMACKDEISPRPDLIVFSDPGWESDETYEYAKWLKTEIERHGIQVEYTSGGNIREDLLQAAADGSRVASLPFLINQGRFSPIRRVSMVTDVDLVVKLIGKRIRTQRKKLKITQSELGSSIGLTRTSITNIETGKQGVVITTLVRIADVLQCDLRDLLPKIRQGE